ncbi:hypothetical protein [Paenibacillus kribbensis]|uniref:hypothetical protein n=1 Tax=Paenibacillus kribbensis TaxID=172713 RepID=UPI002117F14E|nr:hypothetical protein [Paenibacillus kribbensis]
MASLLFNGTYALAASAASTYVVTFQQATLVTENRGRYSGNQAVWEFTYKIKKQ